jgi:NADH-quinone oxidoreductase subunit E
MPTIRPTKVSINDQQHVGQTPKALGLSLAWSPKAEKGIAEILARYPADRSRSAVIPLLHVAQREFGGWLSVDAMQLVADTLGLPYIRVYEVASFYTMFNLQPVGKHHVQVCTNCACMIRGSDAVLAAVKEVTGLHGTGDTSADGQWTLTEVECLGACVAAPMLQVTYADGGMHYFTHLDAAKTKQVLAALQKGDASELADTAPAGVDAIVGGYGG